MPKEIHKVSITCEVEKGSAGIDTVSEIDLDADATGEMLLLAVFLRNIIENRGKDDATAIILAAFQNAKTQINATQLNKDIANNQEDKEME